MKIYQVLLLICSEFGFILSEAIPHALTECYSNDTLENVHLPMNIRVLVDIIQKVEKYSYRMMDLRTISSSLLHKFKIDGIKYYENIKVEDGILPFSATGPQRAKHRLIEEVVPGDPEIFPSDALTLAERCTLHYMVSNTVIKYSSESASKACQQIGQTEKLTERAALADMWDCPRERGVILTAYNTITPGAVIGAIAATLQHQNIALKEFIAFDKTGETSTDDEYYDYDNDEVDFIVPKNQINHAKSMWHHSLRLSPEKIDNTWLTTVAGDLAEMVVYQGPLLKDSSQMTLGATGFWNNTMRPNIYYLTSYDENFEATRAEIIGGIDGLIIANNLQTWIDNFYSLRLSQILEMYYYSDRGISFNSNIRACYRGNNYIHVLPKTIIMEQTYAISHILAYHSDVAYITPKTLKKMVRHAVDVFSTYVNDHLFSEPLCHNQHNQLQMEVLIAFDGAWAKEYTKDFISVLVEDLDISMYGSKMGILHGSSGEFLLNVTNSPTFAYEAISNLTKISWPTQLDYIKTLQTVFRYLNTTWNQNQEKHIIGNFGQAVIFLSPLSYVLDNEKDTVINLLQQIKLHHPDTRFLYYTSESYARFFEMLKLSEEDHIIHSSNIDDIVKYLSTVPQILRPVLNSKLNSSYDMKDQIEDYISPSESKTYRLHSKWKINAKRMIVTAHAFDYGILKICTWNQYHVSDQQTGFYCQNLFGNQHITLQTSVKCSDEIPCPDTYYQIQNVSSSLKCAEMDCRFPDQVRYIIRIQNMHKNSGTLNMPRESFISLFIFINIFFYITIRYD